MRKTPVVALFAGLLSVSGCWWQPGVDAARSNNNGDETTITAANVGQLTQKWATDTGDGPVGALLSANGQIIGVTPYLDDAFGFADTHQLVSLNAGTGTTTWSSDLSAANGIHVARPLYRDGTIVVPAGHVRNGGTIPVAASTGAVGTITNLSAVWAVAMADGQQATGTRSHAVQNPPLVGKFVDWRCDAQVIGGTSSPMPIESMAFVGNNLMWTDGTQAWGLVGCPSGATTFASEWKTELGAQPTGVVGVGADKVAYTDQAQKLTVLNATTGAVVWQTAGIATTEPAVAGGTLLVTTPDNRLVALSAADGAQQWEATLGEAGDRAVVAGNVVYVLRPGSDTIQAFARDGCGSATCTSLTTITVGADVADSPIVDGGRLVVGTVDGQVIAYGLPA